MGSARRFSCANDSGMADLTLYVRPTGSNTNTGLSLSQAVQTQAKAAQLADGYLAGDPDISILVSLGGNLGIPTGGAAADVLFNVDQTYSDLECRLEEGGYSIFGSVVPIVSDGYQTATLAIPSGVTIESVEVDHAMGDPSHVTSDGRRKLYLKYAADAATCQATADTFFHTGTTLHVNLVTVTTGVIVVRYRPATDILMFRLSGVNLRVTGSGPGSCGILYPQYKSSGVACYGVQFLLRSSAHDGYSVSGVRFDGSWHAIGVLDTSVSGTLSMSNISVTNCEFNSEVIGDQESSPGVGTLSYNPIVCYSGNTTPSAFLDITTWVTSGCTFNLYRPCYMDGTSWSDTTDAFGTATIGGFNGNHQAQLLYSHMGHPSGAPRIFGGRFSGCVINIWDYEVIDPYFAQRNYQTYTDTPHSDAAWQSWMEDCTIRSRLTYAAGYAAKRYGACTFSGGTNIRMKRTVWIFPDRMVYAATGGFALFDVSSGTGSNTTAYMEMEECVIAIPTNAATSAANHWCRVIRVGSTNSTVAVFRARNCDFIHNQASMAADMVWFDVEGASTVAKIQCRRCIFHAADNTHHILIYDDTTGQLPLYGTDATALVMEDNWYSNITTGKYDLSQATRDSEAEWRTGADGPHDGIIADANGRSSLHISAGTWNLSALQFGASDAARTTKIASTVTTNYVPSTGINGQPFARYRGAYQYPNSLTTRLALVGAMSAAVGGPNDYDDDEDED